MEWLGELWRRTIFLFRRRQFDAGLEEELRFHLEMKQAEHLKDGMPPEEARTAALRQVGNTTSLKERSRQMWIWGWLEAAAQDTRHAFRLLRRSPGFTLVAVVSLALGIGANTIVFSVLNALVLKTLPIAEPERVYFVNNSGGPSQSFPNYRDLRDHNSTFESLFAYRIAPMSLSEASFSGKGRAERVWGYLVTGNYFQSLRTQPAIGRFFTPAEDTQPNASPFAVLSYACWQNRFAGSPRIVGKEIRINDAKYTVLGVAPRGFHGTESFYWPEIWVPMMMQPQIEGHSWLDTRETFNAWVAGRLKPGISSAQAEANLNSIAAQLARDYSVDEGMRLTLSPPGLVGAMLREPTRAFTGSVMFLAVLVLLAACLNLASLLTARTADRSRDLAVRVSIGAGRGRIARQLLTESLWLSLVGGAAGYGVAVALLRLLTQWRAPLDFPVQFNVNPDWRVFVFASAAAFATGMVFGIAPARRAWKVDPASDLKGSAGTGYGHRWSTRDVLLPIQVALCCVLVTSSLVAVRGLIRSFAIPLGFNPDGATVISYDLGLAGYGREKGEQFQKRAAEAVAHLPGVESVAYSSSVPLSIDQSSSAVYPENTTDFRPKNAEHPSWYYVSPGFFHTAGTRLLAGREFTSQDTPNHPLVAVVNQTFARRVVGTAQAVGLHFRLGDGSELAEIVGVVEDGKYVTLTESPQLACFLPMLQRYSPDVVLIARSGRSESELAAEMRQAVSNLDPQLPVFGVGNLREMIGMVFLPMHAAAIALGAFGLLAIMLSITGIYGLAAYTVSRRAREIGIRMAIGARPAQVLRLVLGRTGALVLAGAIAGLVLGAGGATLMASIVYQASSRDPIVLVTAVVSIALVGMAAAYGPARRALRIDPVQALRSD
jgi:predicted permease